MRRSTIRFVRFIGRAAFWVGLVLGVTAGGLWVANQLGWVQPLIVVSGSMEPDIREGDLLFATPTPAEELEVGDVASLRSEQTGDLVTHRIVGISPVGGLGFSVEMQGDANAQPDPETYVAAGDVWTPALRVPRGGDVVSVLTEPWIVVSVVGVGLLLVALSLAGGRRRWGTPEPAPPEETLVTSVAEKARLVEEARVVAGRGPAGRGPAGRAPDRDAAALAELDEALATLGVDVGEFTARNGRAGETPTP